MMKQEQGTIFKTLDEFRKVELEDIVHFFGAGLSPRMPKRDFVNMLGAYLIEKPKEWLGRMLERDLRLLERLVDAGPEIPLFLDYPDYPSILETVRLVHSDTSDPNFRKLWIGRELYDIVAPHIVDVLARGEESGRFDCERAALGYLNLYGVLTLKEFFKRMLEFQAYEGRKDPVAFMTELCESPVMKLCRFDSGKHRYVSAPSIFDPQEILTGRKKYADVKNIKIFSPLEALEAGSGSPLFVFGLNTPAGRELVAMLQELGYKGDDLVREEHDIWMNSQRAMDEESTEAIFQAVTRKQDSLASFESFNACMQTVATYANSLPKWLLRGHSPDEVNYLKVILQSEEDPIRDLSVNDPLLGLFVPPVPGHTPCPCGSGLLYRNCHGKRLN
jgi:hypothetical protein